MPDHRHSDTARCRRRRAIAIARRIDNSGGSQDRHGSGNTCWHQLGRGVSRGRRHGVNCVDGCVIGDRSLWHRRKHGRIVRGNSLAVNRQCLIGDDRSERCPPAEQACPLRDVADDARLLNGHIRRDINDTLSHACLRPRQYNNGDEQRRQRLRTHVEFFQKKRRTI